MKILHQHEAELLQCEVLQPAYTFRISTVLMLSKYFCMIALVFLSMTTSASRLDDDVL